MLEGYPIESLNTIVLFFFFIFPPISTPGNLPMAGFDYPLPLTQITGQLLCIFPVSTPCLVQRRMLCTL